jgi:signal transduction histidine kinase
LTGLRLRLEEARAAADSELATGEIEAAIGEVDRLSRTVDELLALSSHGQRRPTGAPIDLGDLAAQAQARWRSPAGARAVTLTLKGRSRAGTVWAARDDVERALDALIENAVQYSDRGGVVEIVAGPGEIEVRDHGPGIPVAERELVFERFRRGRTGIAGQPGHGLGLPIARELVRECSGEIVFRDRPGAGTSAAITFSSTGLPPPDRRFAGA